jgi:hypothetical protein
MERLACYIGFVARRTAFAFFNFAMMRKMGKPHGDLIFAAKSGGRNALG